MREARKPGEFFAWLRSLREKWAGPRLPGTEAERFLGTYVPKGERFDVPDRLARGASFFTTEAYLARQERADWQHVDRQLREFAARFVIAARKMGVPLYVHSAFRTAAQQQELLRKGRSKANWPRAPHCQGKAVDIVHASYHWQLQPDEWQFLGLLGKAVARRMGLKLSWGGDWRFYDPAHWEMADWRDDIRQLSAGPPQHMTPSAILSRNERPVLALEAVIEERLKEMGF